MTDSDFDLFPAPHDARTPSSRRNFLRMSILLALPLAGSALPIAVVNAAGRLTGGNMAPELLSANAYNPPSRARGSKKVNVRNYGARGNGTADDTTAFQNAINALLSDGGIVYVPAGTYRIDAVRSVRLRSRMHLQMHPDAKLVAKPTSKGQYRVLVASDVHDLEISGGQIIGERDRHQGTAGEGGHGIKIEGSRRVTIRDILISKCWGDGIVVGPKPVWRAPFIMSQDVVVFSVLCTGNRRNGLSIGNASGVKVYDSEFSDTHGTSPQCGIDVEPDKDIDGNGYCENVHIENCLMRGNAAYGFNVWMRSRNVTVTKCIIERNKTCGLVTRGLAGANFIGNTVRYNRSTGMYIQEGTKNCEVRENIFQANYTKQGIKPRVDFSMVGVTTKVRKDLIVGSGTNAIQVGRNHYR